ncbi:MAG: alpha/beta fold hydrolase [Desulfobacterales bacterium]|nr:alpha/beta fold hydrolase [Desulfobacterales bacterium]
MIQQTALTTNFPMEGGQIIINAAAIFTITCFALMVFAQTAFSMDTTKKTAAGFERVEFESQGTTIKGHLYLPVPKGEQTQPYPAVVVTGAWTTVKEQMPATYAKALSEQGYAALTFDFRGWGESKDKIKYLENPERKIEDIHAALSYLSNRPDIDPARIAGLGICASSGYMAHAAATSSTLRAIALVAPWLHDAAIVSQVYGGETGVKNLIAMGRDAENSKEAVVIEAASTTNENALMYNAPYYTEKNRGLIPEYDNRFNVASWEGWLTFDAQQAADNIHIPVLLVHSEDAAIPQGVKAFAQRMGDTARTVWLDKVSQFDFYDRHDAVAQSVSLVSDHFETTFKSGSTSMDRAMDTAQIKTTLEAMAVLADQNRFEALEDIFADQVTVDYTSLFGGNVERVAVKDLMKRWASFLPGFEVTRHNLTNIDVRVKETTAEASADIRAEHYLDGLFWEVSGTYTYRLTRDKGLWKIAGLTLNFASERGTRDVLALAGEKAAKN